MTASKAAAIIRILSTPGERDPFFVEAVTAKVRRVTSLTEPGQRYLASEGEAGSQRASRLREGVSVYHKGTHKMSEKQIGEATGTVAVVKGWYGPPNSRSWHYIGEDARSLCGKWIVFAWCADLVDCAFGPASRDCAACKKKLDALTHGDSEASPPDPDSEGSL